MARRLREDNVIRERIAVVGTSQAMSSLWAQLKRVATTWKSDEELEIPERVADDQQGAGPPLRLVLHHCALPGPDVPQVDLFASMLAPLDAGPGRTVPIDGLIVAVDLLGPSAGQSRPLLRAVEDVVGMLLEHPDQPRPLPRVLLGLGVGTSFWQEAGTTGWTDDEDALRTMTGEVQASDTRRMLRHLILRLRSALGRQPATPEPFLPEQDLPPSVQEEAARLALDADVSAQLGPRARAEALQRLAQLAHRAGFPAVADAYVARAFEEPAPEVWDALPVAVPLPQATRCLKTWGLKVGTAGGVALTQQGNACLLLLDDTLHRLERHAAAPQPIAQVGDAAVMRAAGADRVVLLGRRLQVRHSTSGELIGEVDFASIRRRLETEAVATEGQAGRLRVVVEPETDRLLVLLPLGLVLFELSTLRQLAWLARTDIVAAEVLDSQRVATVHTGGMLGHWRAETSIVHRTANLPGRVVDAWVSVAANRAATLVAQGRARVVLALWQLDSGRSLGECDTRGATSVRLSADGQRLLTLEHRLLRLRDASSPLTHETRATTLFDPPPWMPVHVDVAPDARIMAVLARTLTGSVPLRLNLWG